MAVTHAWQFAERTRAGAGDGIAAILGLLGNPDLISFAGGFPDPRTFPRDRVAELVREVDAGAFQYAPTQGLAGTREAIAGRLERRPSDDELLVTSGGIEALELVSKSFLDRGDAVVVEAPTYLGAIMAFRSFEADVHAVPIDDDGLDVDALAALLEGGVRPKLLYTIPEHQNPGGVMLAAARRTALVELARRYGFLIVEDVAYRELTFDGAPPESLWSLGPDVVVQAGTTSKTFFPGLRLGWAIAPPEISQRLVSAKQNTDQCAGALGQRLFEEYGRAGHFERQIPIARALYASHWNALAEALERHMPDGCEWTRPAGGFLTWLTLPAQFDTLALRDQATAAGVAYVPGRPFYPDGRGANELRLSFSHLDEQQLAEAARRLAQVLSD
jgi:2-aminoadipate transaminase